MTGERRATGQSWSAAQVRAALRAITRHLERHAQELNTLNVFPVADADTGTNLTRTVRAAAEAAARCASASAGAVLDAAAEGALFASYGNSGIILAQALRGLAEAARGAQRLTAPLLVQGLNRAAELAYQAIAHPVEGTMLTVLRVVSEQLEPAPGEDASLATVLVTCRDIAFDTAAHTPAMLPMLQRAGVVDAGAWGLALIFDAASAYALGVAPLAKRRPASPSPRPTIELLDDEASFCVNLIVVDTPVSAAECRRLLTPLGTSVAVVRFGERLKVHLHAKEPEHVLHTVQAFGHLADVHLEPLPHKALPRGGAIPQGSRILAISLGPGLADAIQRVGGMPLPAQAPALQAALAELRQSALLVPASEATLTMAKDIAEGSKQVLLVPARTIPEQLAALSVFEASCSPAENEESMTAALTRVTTVEVCRAEAEETWFAHCNDGSLVTAHAPDAAVLAALARLDLDQAERVTVVVGEDGPDGERVASALRARWPHLRVDTVDGGQSFPPLVIGVE